MLPGPGYATIRNPCVELNQTRWTTSTCNKVITVPKVSFYSLLGHRAPKVASTFFLLHKHPCHMNINTSDASVFAFCEQQVAITKGGKAVAYTGDSATTWAEHYGTLQSFKLPCFSTPPLVHGVLGNLSMLPCMTYLEPHGTEGPTVRLAHGMQP